jgi:adenosylcobinamide kinase / adenosylcobinamide-phosphate guanylyltransferase
MDEPSQVARSELILGGQKSGKSRRAESLALAWLSQSPRHQAVLIATAQPGDEEMRERIARHRQDRAERVTSLQTVEEPLQLAEALQQHSQPHTLVVVDGLTLWLTNRLMPSENIEDIENIENTNKNQSNRPIAQYPRAQAAMILIAIEKAAGPVVLVGNEIGLGVIPFGREMRAFVDALVQLKQNAAKVCKRVTFMATGLPLTLKGQP